MRLNTVCGIRASRWVMYCSAASAAFAVPLRPASAQDLSLPAEGEAVSDAVEPQEAASSFESIAESYEAVSTPDSVADQPATIEEPEPEVSNAIIVTASKRERTLQDTPIAVSVTSGEVIERAQIRDVLDLQTVVPSLRVEQQQSSSSTTFFIRGFGNGSNNLGIEPSVGVFVDGVFRSRSAGALSDLNMVERIEVLSGPQSTLFGKNASAGVISVVTKEPQYEWGGVAEVSAGNFDAFVIRGEVTGPLAENVAFSLDGSYNQREGYAEIVNLEQDLSDRDRWSARGQLLIEPTADIKVRAIADYSRIDEVCCQVSTLVAGPTADAIRGAGGDFGTDFFGYDAFLNRAPINEVDNYGGSVQVDWNVGALTVTSITAYRELKNFQDQDVDFTSADMVSEVRDQRANTFTQELRIASDFDGPFNFLLGGFYFDESIKQDSTIDAGADTREVFTRLARAQGQPNFTFNDVELALGLPQNSVFSPGPLTAERFAMDNRAISVFGTLDFEPVDGLTLTAGFNYTDDRKKFMLEQDSFDELGNVNLVDAFITRFLTFGTVQTREQFQALPPATQARLAAAATDPNVNPFLPLGQFQFLPPFLSIPNAVEDGRTRDDDVTYLLRAAYRLTPEINVYASYATGFKASSINLSRDSRPTSADFIPGPRPATPPDGARPATNGGSNFLAPSSPITDAGLPITNLSTGTRVAGPEEAQVYELGVKAQFDDIGFNLALFDQSIEGFQDFSFTGTGFLLANAGKQSVRGFEFDTTVTPLDGFIFTLGATYLDALFDSFTNSPVGDLSGRRPGNIPELNLRTSATYTWELGSSGNVIVTRADYSYESNTRVNNGLPTFNAALGNEQVFEREVNLVNGSITLELESGLQLGAWARNLLDDEYIITTFDGVAQAGTVSGYPSQPRTYGGLVRYRF
jgi:outer membrane receptor protein involved in Fe transport